MKVLTKVLAKVLAPSRFLLFPSFLLMGLLLSAADSCEGAKPDPSYDVTPTLTTPKGVRVDPTGQEVDLAAIDCIVDRVEACLVRKFGNPAVIPEDLAKSAQCPKTTFALPIAREKLILKIPAEIASELRGLDYQPVTREGLGWHLNCSGTEQLLTIAAGSAGCMAKGLTPTNTCPCRWRANMLGSDTIVATPSLYLFPDWLIRYSTGCQNPWANEAFAECATPATGPLDKIAHCTNEDPANP